MFDRRKTRALAALLAVPDEDRPEDWQETFFDLAWTAAVGLDKNWPFQGPDGFHYVRLNVDRPGLVANCLASVVEGCLDKGLGAAFYASASDPLDQPAFALSFGLLDSLVRFDSPLGDPIDVAEAAEPLPQGTAIVAQDSRRQTLKVGEPAEILAGVPSPEYLPLHTVRALGAYLEQGWGLDDPRVLLIVDPKMRPARSLMIGRKFREFPPGHSPRDMTDHLLWYFPLLRSVTLMPEDWTLEEMVPLRELAGLEPGEDWWPQA